MANENLTHWADQTADKIIRERGDLDRHFALETGDFAGPQTGERAAQALDAFRQSVEIRVRLLGEVTT